MERAIVIEREVFGTIHEKAAKSLEVLAKVQDRRASASTAAVWGGYAG
jgi:hypothetical protein